MLIDFIIPYIHIFVYKIYYVFPITKKKKKFTSNNN
nr:MAG TPA: hypothetical protein [Caudoviricetes sp.]